MRNGTASALAFLVIYACKAEDQVLTPDDQDAAVKVDSGSSVIVGDDASANADASQGANPGIDATVGGTDAATNDAALVVGNDAATVGPEAGSTTQGAKDPDCDLNGIWIARQNTESIALGSQYANNWYYFEFAQEGEQVVVAKHMDCGISVRSFVASVDLLPATTRALIGHNLQAGRKGTFAKQTDGTCAFQLEKFWSVRGVSEQAYAPKPRNREATIAQLQAENPLPTKAMVGATEDWDGDGKPGIAWQVSVLGVGTRHSAQRDWTRWFSAPGYQVTAATDFGSLVLRADFSNEEVVYDATDETLETLSEPNASAEHALTLRFLGRTRDDPRAQAVLKADDFETCMAIQAALPAIAGLK